MKKLLSTKKNCSKIDRYKQPKIDPPKRMVTSTWNTRNDSSNISSILQPENYTISPKTEKGVYKKCILEGNNCYCREKKIRPKLMSRPKSCLSLDDLKQKIMGKDLLRRPLDQHYATQECHCKNGAGDHYSKDLTLLKRYQEELESKCDCLEHTDSRKDYQIFREKQNEDDLRELEKYQESKENTEEENDTEKEEEEEEHLEKEEGHSLMTIMGTRLGIASTTSSPDLDHQPPTVTDLNAFRNDHYFETHGTGDLEKAISKHTCVHQFRLDDRLLPEPLNVDAFGRSRCSICSKPMEGDTMQLSRPYFSERPSSVTLRNLAKCSELGLVPRSISLGGSKSRVELKVDTNERRKLGMVVGKIRRPEYFNTFALRQQRMNA